MFKYRSYILSMMSEKIKSFQDEQKKQNQADIESAEEILRVLTDMQSELDDETQEVNLNRIREIVADLTFSFAEIYKQIIRSRCSTQEFDKILNELYKDEVYAPTTKAPETFFI